jgi:S1-C subfamily serine protease
VRDLIRFGKVKRPYIGIVGKNILSSDEVETGDTLGGVYGVIVTNPIVEGPGHRAGLKIGDLIMGLDQEKVTDMNQLQRFMTARAPSDHVRLKVYRRGRGFFYANLGLDEFPKASDLPISKDLF